MKYGVAVWSHGQSRTVEFARRNHVIQHFETKEEAVRFKEEIAPQYPGFMVITFTISA